MNKIIKIIIYISLACLVLLLFTVVFIFYSKFSNHVLSEDISQWGQTGDYFGGILNPIISLMSLLVLGYITLRISQIEHERARQNIAPLPDILIDDYETHIRIDLRNHGIGPMIVKEIIFKDLNTEETQIFNLLPTMPQEFIRNWWNTNYNSIITSNSSKTLLSIRPMDTGMIEPGHKILKSFEIWNDMKPKIRGALKDITIVIKYVDNIDPKAELILTKTLDAFKG